MANTQSNHETLKLFPYRYDTIIIPIPRGTTEDELLERTSCIASPHVETHHPHADNFIPASYTRGV